MTLDKAQSPISNVRLLWMSAAMFATVVLANRFLNRDWTNCIKVWVNTGAFHNCVIQTAPPSLAGSLIRGAFVATLFFFFFRRISRRSGTYNLRDRSQLN